MKRWLCVGWIASAGFVLQGCEFARSLGLDFEMAQVEVEVDVDAEDPAVMALTDAALRAEAALAALARARAADNPVDVEVPPKIVPDVLQEPVNLEWIGPLETLAERLAASVGYEFIVAGDRPPVTVMVTINAVDSPLVLVLRDAGIQAADNAKLTVDASEQVVRLEWADTKGELL